jgi:FkbM family methyltransferase
MGDSGLANPQTAFSRLARFANDSYYLLRTPHKAGTKAKLWFHLLHPSAKVLDFKVASFDLPALEYLYREIFIRQYYYFRTEPDSPVIFDCGANLGMATLYFKWLYPKSRIQAFEPDPDTFALLQTNVNQNSLADVTTHNCALWDEDKKIEFFVDGQHPGSLLMSADASRSIGDAIQVPARKLSEFINGPVDFLKMDVEGAEDRVLSDLVSSGAIRFIRQMVIEYHHRAGVKGSRLAAFLDKLERAGFDYQFHASLWPVASKNVYQDMMIGAYRNEAGGALTEAKGL